MEVPARGKVTVDVEECKGCGVCVVSCPTQCLELAPELNGYGAHPAHYAGKDCTGCGICFYCCPEPGAIRVFSITAELELPAIAKGAGSFVVKTWQGVLVVLPYKPKRLAYSPSIANSFGLATPN